MSLLGNVNLSLPSYLLNFGQQCDIVATGSLVSDLTSGNVQAKTIVVSINSVDAGRRTQVQNGSLGNSRRLRIFQPAQLLS